MGNIIAKLNNILSSKIAISGAIEAKGVSVNSAPFSSYANLISQINSSEGSIENIDFYKCASIISSSSSNEIVIEGLSIVQHPEMNDVSYDLSKYNGTYELLDDTKAHTSKIYKKKSADLYLIQVFWEDEGIKGQYTWGLGDQYPTDNIDPYTIQYNADIYLNKYDDSNLPIGSTTWSSEIDSWITTNVTISEAPGTPTRWSGYKLTMTSGGITYSNELTTDLSGNAEIGGIYSADGSQRIYEDTLIPANIKSGVEILGISGTLQEGVNTSDATATSATILSGYSAYVNGEKVTGSYVPEASSSSDSVKFYKCTEISVSESSSEEYPEHIIVSNSNYPDKDINGRYTKASLAELEASQEDMGDSELTQLYNQDSDTSHQCKIYQYQNTWYIGPFGIFQQAIARKSGSIIGEWTIPTPVQDDYESERNITLTNPIISSEATNPNSWSGQKLITNNGIIELDSVTTSGIELNGFTPVTGMIYAVSGNMIIGTDTNLVPSSIVSGVSIFGVSGTAIIDAATIGSTPTEFYKCVALVPAQPGNNIEISGISIPEDANGIYEIQNSDAVGQARIWTKSVDDHIYTIKFDDGNGGWTIFYYSEMDGEYPVFYDYESSAYDSPTDSNINWQQFDSSGSPVLSQTTGTNASWNGNKAILTGDAYAFEETITSGLLYSTLPITGTIYAVQHNEIIGSVPSAQISINGTSVSISKGIVTENTIKTISDENLIAANIKSGVTIFGVEGTLEATQTVEESSDNITLGYIDSNKNFQALSFNGTTPSNSGEAQVIDKYNTWNSGVSTEATSLEFYKCAEVIAGSSDNLPESITVSEFELYDYESEELVSSVNGAYTKVSDETVENWNYNNDFSSIYLYEAGYVSENGCIIKGRYVEDSNATFWIFKYGSSYEGPLISRSEDEGSSWDSLSDAGNFTGTIGTITFNYAASNSSWSGQKVILSGGVYTFEETVTSGLVYSEIIPVTGGIYSSNALMKIETLYTGNNENNENE